MLRAAPECAGNLGCVGRWKGAAGGGGGTMEWWHGGTLGWCRMGLSDHSHIARQGRLNAGQPAVGGGGSWASLQCWQQAVSQPWGTRICFEGRGAPRCPGAPFSP